MSLPTPFRLHDLASELQLLVLEHITHLPPCELVSAARVSRSWQAAITPHLYESIIVSKSNREAIFSGLGLDYLSAVDLESRALEAAPTETSPLAMQKLAALAHTRHVTISDVGGANALAEAIIAYDALFANIDELILAAPVFRNLVNSGLAAFGRPRSGSAFVGETLVARLRPRRVRIHYPTPRSGAGVFDPVLLARVMAVLLIDWQPDSVEYHGVVSDFPPVLGANTRIHCGPCSPKSAKAELHAWDGDTAICSSHGALVRMHLRRIFGPHARDELLEAIAEGADPTDDDDLDPDDIPDAAHAKIEYYGVPCIATTDRDAFLDKTFAQWPVDIDVAERVAFFA